jgi:predicted metal-dependent hydrolase
MDYTVIRSRRRTIAVEITRNGEILVRAPLRLADREVKAFVERHRGWVDSKLARARQQPVQAAPRRFREGEMFLFLGMRCRLRFVAGGEYLRLENGEFLLGADLASRAGDLFRTWYRARAREVFEDRVAHFAPRMGLSCRAVRITDARGRWGSCSPSGTLNLAWRLVMAPPGVVDYVIVHELAHLVEMNHSRRFWDCVAGVLPDHRARRAWLRENEPSLDG